MSDHYPVCITRKLYKVEKSSKHIEIKYRDFKKVDETSFLNDLSEVNFGIIEQIQDPNAVLNTFYSLIFGTVEKHAKIKVKRVRNQFKPSWLTPDINEARHKRDLYHKRKDDTNYKYWRNKVIDLIKKAKEQYYKQVIEENKNSSDIWNYIKELGPKSAKSTPNTLTFNERTATDTSDIADMFNDYFTNLSNNLLSGNPDYQNTLHTLRNYTQTKLQSFNEFRIRPIDETEVFSMLRKLQTNKSTGVDCLGPRLLKLSAPIISKCVAHMINKSIEKGIFPNELKIAKVTPIFKKGARSDPGNYRPISILPTISKLFERHVAAQIHKFLTKFKLLHTEQSEFRQFHSC